MDMLANTFNTEMEQVAHNSPGLEALDRLLPYFS